jgi:hypothetical protein
MHIDMYPVAVTVEGELCVPLSQYCVYITHYFIILSDHLFYYFFRNYHIFY